LPCGYHHIDEHRVVGNGPAEFQRAATDLFRCEVHRRAGLRIITSTDRVVKGALITSTLGLGGFGGNAPCIVVAVVDEPELGGWAYGTLPGHPECGEEGMHPSTDRNTTCRRPANPAPQARPQPGSISAAATQA